MADDNPSKLSTGGNSPSGSDTLTEACPTVKIVYWACEHSTRLMPPVAFFEAFLKGFHLFLRCGLLSACPSNGLTFASRSPFPGSAPRAGGRLLRTGFGLWHPSTCITNYRSCHFAQGSIEWGAIPARGTIPSRINKAAGISPSARAPGCAPCAPPRRFSNPSAPR